MYPQSFAVRNSHLGVQRLCKLLPSTTITKSLLALSDLWSHPGTAHTMLFMHIDTFWFQYVPMTSIGCQHGGLITLSTEIWCMCREPSTKRLLYLQHAPICACVQTAASLSGIRAARARGSAKMRLKWQFEFTAAFIRCHDLLCSTWTCDEWRSRISQWSHFESPLALREGSAFSAGGYVSPGLHTRWGAGRGDVMVQMPTWMTLHDWAFLQISRKWVG